ncbi:MAG: 30S ribosomal protein S17 [Verrucomicrobiales bacterium]|nr:30S ribosomal protein S17 [Verrucomicrobiae bacterium]MCC6884386.1 30S ribosomal protein S17 [Verrucomicrobiales bacterium]MCP5554134.1 30S ribosomal protein S17 [Akkermansiaceae bacterium]
MSEANQTEETKPRVQRKTRIGVVVSDKMTKTIAIDVVRRVPHPRYKKIIKRTKRLYAHDEEGLAKVGDKVRIMETRPLSKLKRWTLLEVLAH